MSIIQIATPFNIDIEFEIAEFHKRLLAYIIDFVILMMYMIAMMYILFGELKISDEGSIGFVILVLVLPMLFYTFLTELWLNGQTIGKKVLRIRVVSLDGGEATLGQTMLRWFLRFYEWGFVFTFIFFFNPVSAFLILLFGGITTVVIIAVTPNNQRLGDLIAGTVVVNTRSLLTVNDTIFMEVNTADYKVTFPDVMRLSDRDINTIKGVVTQANKTGNYEMCNRVAMKVKDVLKISTLMHPDQFLDKLLEDYNYLATRE